MNVLKLLKFNLKIDKKKICVWCLSSFIIIFLYIILFPYVQDVARVEMEMMPKELLQVFGISSYTDLGNFNNYFDSIYNIFVLAISIYSVILATNLVEKEEKNKTIEFLYSLNISRNEIIISKILTVLISIILIITSAFLSTCLCGFINGGETFKIFGIFRTCLNSIFITLFFASIGVFIGGSYLSKSDLELGAGITVFMYLSGVLSIMLGNDFKFLKYISPFEVVKNNNLFIIGIYIVICIILICLGIKNYNKRDFNI